MKEQRLFKMSELFSSFERGKVHSADLLPVGNTYFYVGAKKKENGVMKRCGYAEELVSKGNCIIFICNGEGSVGYCNYMDRDFLASGDLILAYGDFLDKYVALYMITYLDMERPKYSFGRKYGKYVKNTTIPLPVNQNDEPDWEWIRNYVKNEIIPHLPERSKAIWNGNIKKDPIISIKMNLFDRPWGWFEIGDERLFKIEKGKRLTKADMIDGNIPYIGAIDSNNGLSALIANNEQLHEANTITVSYNGSIAEAFYQDKEYWATDDVNVLYPNFALNKYIAMFIITILHNEKYRFNYGRKWKKELMEKSKIKLPVDESGNPDWLFMEDFIKSLPYSSNI